MSDVPCVICGRLIERWGRRWRHVGRANSSAHRATAPASRVVSDE